MTLTQRAVLARLLPIKITNTPEKIGNQISKLSSEFSIIKAQVMGYRLQIAPKLK